MIETRLIENWVKKRKRKRAVSNVHTVKLPCCRTQVNVDSRVLPSSEKNLASQAGSAPKYIQSQRLIRKQEENNPTQPQPQARHNSLRFGSNMSIFGLSRPTEKTERNRQTYGHTAGKLLCTVVCRQGTPALWPVGRYSQTP